MTLGIDCGEAARGTAVMLDELLSKLMATLG